MLDHHTKGACLNCFDVMLVNFILLNVRWLCEYQSLFWCSWMSFRVVRDGLTVEAVTVALTMILLLYGGLHSQSVCVSRRSVWLWTCIVGKVAMWWTPWNLCFKILLRWTSCGCGCSIRWDYLSSSTPWLWPWSMNFKFTPALFVNLMILCSMLAKGWRLHDVVCWC